MHHGHQCAGHSQEGGFGGHHHHGSDDMMRLRIALAIIVLFAAVEIVGGVLSGSLALLADAGHMVTDAVALALALGAKYLAQRPASDRFNFGHQRTQVLAAFLNGVGLFLLIAYLLVESVHRMAEPATIEASTMLNVAVIGLLANIAAFWVLQNGTDDVNMRGAVLHVIGDLLGSVAAIVSAIIILFTGWVVVDVLVTLLVCGLIARSAYALVKETGVVLLEGAPQEIDPTDLRDVIRRDVRGVTDVHNVRLWMLTPGANQATMHVRVRDPYQGDRILEDIKSLLAARGILDSTIQIEMSPPSVWSPSTISARPAEAQCPDEAVRAREGTDLGGIAPIPS
ncbi:Cation efflux protein [Parvularcula bermudensis HTCC2503]|uniref:Cation efflux protein n=1 Tax=Parvularcula bermudensis (strain ATCC BAA-594 / HTCC2503 / KCTC 12087) TaxID=314260 RepID=E0TBR2_PARBH|nr:cation diffusion facilitator family transporter [Parvularcula bermudensis]ADM09783.1 Cation efflux protein [Parvularcula bermudensis HTCC2503]